MALIECPECKTKVSDQAEKCPSCAYPITTNEPIAPVQKQVVVKSKEGCFLQTLNTGCLIVGIIIAIIVLITVIGILNP